MKFILPSLYLLASLPARTFAAPGAPARCAGDGWRITIDLNPGDQGTDRVDVVATDAAGRTTRFDASITSGRYRDVLRAGLIVTNKDVPDDLARIRFERGRSQWTHLGQTAAVTCHL